MNFIREQVNLLKAVTRKAVRWAADRLLRGREAAACLVATHSRRMRTELSYVTSVLGFIINVAYVMVGNHLVRSRLEHLARALFSAPQRGPAELTY